MKKKSRFSESLKKTIKLFIVGGGIVIFGVIPFCFGEAKVERNIFRPGEEPKLPVGRWAAAYTEEFAKTHGLPMENVSKDLSPGVDYLEMDVLQVQYPLGTQAQCIVNFLAKNPNDYSYASWKIEPWEERLNKERTLLHMLQYPKNLKPNGFVSAFFGSTNYDAKNHGFTSSTAAYVSENLLPGYDYISSFGVCAEVFAYVPAFVDKFGIRMPKASVWGKYEDKFNHDYDAPGRPHGEDFEKSYVWVKIPAAIIKKILKGVYYYD